ncbi:MAG TPA: flagellar protein [Candidatus Atribacteria bacterium]|nr:flagellar protein [Candidatus Atribacteria bacterium]
MVGKLVDRLFNYTQIPYSGSITGRSKSAQKVEKNEEHGKDFSKILNEKIQQEGSIKFSSHAMERIKKRNIIITQKDMKNIEKAVEQAEKKGVNEALFVGSKFSLIISVKNKTVITAIDEKSMKNNIFTNIDSAVIL